MRHETENHKGRSYKIRITKTERTIARIKRHVKTTLISVEDYVRNDMLKAKRMPTGNKSIELIDCFIHLQKHQHINGTETEGKVTVLRILLLPKHRKAEHTKAIIIKQNILWQDQDRSAGKPGRLSITRTQYN